MLEPDDDPIDEAMKSLGERLEAIVKNLLAVEMLDSISITVTYQLGGKTSRDTVAAGNWYANFGAMQAWLKERDA